MAFSLFGKRNPDPEPEAPAATEPAAESKRGFFDRMKQAVTRTRDTSNRRVQVVALTEAGEEAFLRLREAAMAFDAVLRAGLADEDLATLGDLLGALATNVGAESAPAPWTGLADHR